MHRIAAQAIVVPNGIGTDPVDQALVAWLAGRRTPRSAATSEAPHAPDSPSEESWATIDAFDEALAQQFAAV
jgi:hypothetical protein